MAKKATFFLLKYTTNFGVHVTFLCRKNSELDFEKQMKLIKFAKSLLKF